MTFEIFLDCYFFYSQLNRLFIYTWLANKKLLIWDESSSITKEIERKIVVLMRKLAIWWMFVGDAGKSTEKGLEKSGESENV